MAWIQDASNGPIAWADRKGVSFPDSGSKVRYGNHMLACSVRLRYR